MGAAGCLASDGFLMVPLGAASGFACVVLLTLYIQSQETAERHALRAEAAGVPPRFASDLSRRPVR